MNDISKIINEIKEYVVNTFNSADLWFDKENQLKQYQPKNGGWSITQILEHIGLTNFFLLKLIEKGTKKALQKLPNANLQVELNEYQFHKDKLTEIGLHKSFLWIRPEHMEPQNKLTEIEVRQQLKDQVDKCLEVLKLLKNGEGVLCKTTMIVNELGKIDVYEYIYFLAQHCQRHITQMEKNEKEFFENI